MYYKKNFIIVILIKRIKFTLNVRIIVIMGLLDIYISKILTINFNANRGKSVKVIESAVL